MSTETDQTRLALYYQAEAEILATGQSIAAPGGRMLTRVNLMWVREMIKVLEARVARSTGGPILLGRGRG